MSNGAPQAILALVAGDKTLESIVNEAVDAFATKGYRALGVARADAQHNWNYLGLIAIYDPQRGDSAQMIAAAESMGIEVKMVTGDHRAIAGEVAA